MCELRTPPLRAPLLSFVWTAAAGQVQHFFYPEIDSEHFNLGSNVASALPSLELGLALGLKPICNPALFHNAAMQSTDPNTFGLTVGCGTYKHEGKTWPIVTGYWAKNETAAQLQWVDVTWCSIADEVEKHRSADTPAVFRLHATPALKALREGSTAARFLREQRETLMNADRKQKAIEEWQDEPDISLKIGVYLRAEGWYADRKGPGSMAEPPDLGPFAAHVARSLRAISEFRLQAGQIAASSTRILVMAVFPDDEASKDSMDSILKEFGRLQKEFPRMLMVATNVKEMLAPEKLVHDIDVLASADYLILGPSRFADTLALVQKDDGEHFVVEKWYEGPKLANTVFVPINAAAPVVPSKAENRAAARRGLDAAAVAKLRDRLPDTSCGEARDEL